MGYTKDTIKGIFWVGGFRFVTRIIAFVRIAILARILIPTQFGIYGIAFLALALLEVATETGVNVVLVQKKERIERYINSAWIVSIIRGIIISFFILVSAPFISHFFRSKESLTLLQLISIVPFLRGFINPSVLKFQKELKFKRESWYKSSIFFVDSSAAIIIALLTHQANSLVFGLIVGSLFEIALSFSIAKPRPRFILEREYMKNILHRGKWVTASGIFNYLFHNLDDVVVGRLLGTSSLGLYQMGYKISTLPISEGADVVSKVTFPIYTRISNERLRLKRAFLKTTLALSALTIPFGLILFIFSKEIVAIILGEKWLEVVPALRVLAIFGVVRAISGSASALFLAVERQEYITIVTLISIVGLAVSIIPLVLRFGIVGAGISALIGSLLAVPVFVYFILKTFNNLKKGK